MDPVSAAIFVLLLAVPAAFTAGVFKRAHANGRALPSREDWRPRFMDHSAPVKPGGGKSGTKGGKRARPATARAIFAAAIADNWVAKRAHRRQQGTRLSFGRRLLVHKNSNARRAPPAPPTGPAGDRPAPDPTAPGGTPVTTPTAPADGTPAEPPSPISNSNGHTGGSAGGGGAAADFFHSITAVTGPAKAGGLRSKQRAVKTLATGMPMMASALEEFARWCQEPAQGYGSPLFERLQKMANCIRAAGMEGAEADSYMTSLAGKPLGEVAGSNVQAPSSREINTE